MFDVLPSQAEDITPDWLTQTLRETGVLTHGMIAEVKAEPVARQGQVGNVSRLKVSYDGQSAGLPDTVVVKIGLPQKDASWNVAHENEFRFYTEIAKANPHISSPRCYAAKYDRAKHRLVLLLEDLSGARQGDGFLPSVRDVEAALVNIAGFHARWWKDATLVDAAWLQQPGKGPFDGQGFMSELIPLASERYPEHFCGYMRDAAHALERKWEQFQSHWQERALTLNHGDFNTWNIYYEVDASRPVVVFDWQALQVGSPTIDVSRVLLDGLSAEQLQSHQEQLVQKYYDALSAHGVETISLERLLSDTRLSMLSHLVFTLAWTVQTDVEFADEVKELTGQDWRTRFFDDLSESLARNRVIELLATL